MTSTISLGLVQFPEVRWNLPFHPMINITLMIFERFSLSRATHSL